MTDRDIACLAMLGQWASVIVAAIGLYFVWQQLHQSSSHSAWQSIMDVQREFRDRTDDLLNSNDSERRRKFFHLANFAESQAYLLLDKGVDNKSRHYIQQLLIGIMASLSSVEPAKRLLEEGVDSESTFENIRKFYAVNKNAILARADQMEGR